MDRGAVRLFGSANRRHGGGLWHDTGVRRNRMGGILVRRAGAVVRVACTLTPINRFEKYDPAGPWRQLADGITASGIQQSWPLEDSERVGLLPDSYQLRPQVRSGPAINPGTVQSTTVRYYRQPAAYDFHAFPWHGLLVHAAGELGAITETSGGVEFIVTNWSSAPASLMVTGFTDHRVLLDGQQIQVVAPHQYQPSSGRLVLRLQGTVRVQIVSPAVPRLEKKHASLTF